MVQPFALPHCLMAFLQSDSARVRAETCRLLTETWCPEHLSNFKQAEVSERGAVSMSVHAALHNKY
jgi:hypothetical protein